MKRRRNRPEAAPPGAARTGAGPLRTCLITRNQRPSRELLRMVDHPELGLIPDLTGRFPGRGIHVTPSRVHVRALLKRRRCPAAEIAPFLTRLEELLAQRLLDGIGLARRAGSLRRGLEESGKALEAVGKRAGTAAGDPGGLLLLAADSAANTREKAERLAARLGMARPLEVLDRDRFGAVQGGGLVAVLAVVENPGICRRVGGDARRWLEYTGS